MEFTKKQEGLTLRQTRKLLGKTQKELAAILNVASVTIRQWENGRREPKLTMNQIKILEELLKEENRSFSDLSSDLSNKKTHNQQS